MIKNNTHISIPIQCAAYAPGKIFLRSMAIRREAKSELGHDLVDREAETPKLTIRIHERPVEVRVNQSINEWETEEAEIDEETVSWEIIIMVGGGLMALVFITVGGKLLFKAWKASRGPTHPVVIQGVKDQLAKWT